MPGMGLDMLTLTVALALGGATAAIFYPFYLWVTFGMGFRYGRRYLFVSAASSLLSFALVIAASAYWRGQAALATGLWIALLVLPAYASSLLTKLTDALTRAEEASRTKSRFLATMSHELRTPVARHHRHGRPAARHPARGRAAGHGADRARRRPEPARDDRRSPRDRPDRVRAAGAGDRLRPPRPARIGALAAPPRGAREGARLPSSDRSRGALPAAWRPALAAADPGQPDRQRGQVHRPGQRHHPGRRGGGRRRAGGAQDRGRGHRHRNSQGRAGAHLRALHPGRRVRPPGSTAAPASGSPSRASSRISSAAR